MAHIEYIAGLDPEDLTAKQWRKLFRSAKVMRSQDKPQEDQDEEIDRAAKENEDLVNLQEEKKGKSKAPKVAADDLPEGLVDEEETEEKKPKKKARG